MIWKNPFLIKNNEQYENESEYLSLFDSTVLEIIEEQNLDKVSYVSSTPGAGKTSLFRAFSSKVLGMLLKDKNNDNNREFLKYMRNLGVIKDEKISLISAMLSCARGYNIIDEMFENGRRKQVLFALLNYRVTIVFLKSICNLLDMHINDLEYVTFKKIPDEMLSDENSFKNALCAYKWACNGEKELCRYLDGIHSESLELSFVHTTLLSIKLFEGSNILVNGEEVFSHSILIFDDFHKLTENQRSIIPDAIYTLKSNTGVWLGQRLEGLRDTQVISMDGSLGRDYNPNIVIDTYWSSKQNVFYKILERIANKRIKESGIASVRNFNDCIDSNIKTQDYKNILLKYISDVKSYIQKYDDTGKYKEAVEYIDKIKNDIYRQALYYETVKVKINRDNFGQMEIDFNESVSFEELTLFYEKNKNTIEFYLAYNSKIPFYYGLEKLQKLSSYNIEQFLFFASGIFEDYRAKMLGNRRAARLTAEEQETSLRKSAERRWNDMDYRYSNTQSIKIFIKNIVLLGQKSRDIGRGSYAGGSYTGIGINKNVLSACIKNDNYKEVINILAKCLASKYLERREVGDMTVFYLNRWICLYFNLPLAYGGWKHCDMDQLKRMCRENNEQMSLLD